MHKNKKWIKVIDEIDYTHEMREQLSETIAWLENLVDENILIHCQMGISRSATIVIALMMKRYKIDLKTAFKKVID